MSQLTKGRDAAATALEDVEAVLRLYEDPKNPESMRKIKTIQALFRASQGAENALSWGEAMSPGVRLKFFLFCAKQGFDPASNHVYVLGGRPYVSIEGRSFKADEHRDDAGKKTFQGFAEDRVMTADERAAYDVPEGAIGWLCRVKRADCEFPFLGVGYAGGAGERNPVAKADRLAMAAKRAREKALRLAYPLGDASDDEGEILDAKFTVVDATATATETPPADKPTTTTPPADDALTAARARFKAAMKDGGQIASATAATHGLAKPADMAAADAAKLNACSDAIDAARNDPSLPAMRQEIARLRATYPDEFNAKLAEARGLMPAFDPEKSPKADVEAFLADLKAATAAEVAQ